jgi:hypothetical protein
MSGEIGTKDCCGGGGSGEFSKSLVAYRSQSEHHRVCDQSSMSNLGSHPSKQITDEKNNKGPASGRQCGIV